MEGPVIPSVAKAEADLEEKRRYNVLFLDPDLQKPERCCGRLKAAAKVFC